MKTVLSLLVLAFSLHAADAVLDVGDRKQLFIDRRFIAGGQGIRLVMNPPTKMETVLRPEKPWELGWVVGYGTILEDQGKFKMWYTALPPGKIDSSATESLLCYAESDDGIHWRKPNLGLYEWRGSKANNILLQAGIETSTVFVDPKAPDHERYKLLAVLGDRDRSPAGGGLYLYASPDGLRWKLNPTRVYPFNPDSQNQAFWDTRLNKYVIYVQKWGAMRKVGRIETGDIQKPWPFDASVASIYKWGKNRTPPPGPETPTAFSYDDKDPQPSDHYTSAAVQYPWAQDVYLMFPAAYYHTPEPPKGRFSNDGPVDIQMAVSRDGVTYSRVERKPYVELGMKGQPDSGSVYMLVGMIRTGDEISQYYSAFPFTHGAYRGLGEEFRIGAIMRVSQRLDGFVCADAGPEGGTFATPALHFSGRRLVLNLNASALGEVKVELRDEAGRVLPGFSFADCDPSWGNDTARTITWNAKGDVGPISGRSIRVAFAMRSAKLYAFQFVP